MTQMWVTAGAEGWWKAYGWKELRRAMSQGVEEVLMEHEETIELGPRDDDEYECF